MEPEHEGYVRKHWPAQAPKVRVLGIPDVYEPDDPELRDRLTEVVRGLLAEASGDLARLPGRVPAPRGAPAESSRTVRARAQARRRLLSRNRMAARTAATSSSRLNGLTR